MSNFVKPVEMTDQRSNDATRRLLMLLSLSAGLLYPLLDGRFGPVADVLLKGSAVGLLAIAAVLGKGSGFRWLAAIMLAGAIGDMILETPGGLEPGGAAFAVGHAIAIIFYLRNRRHPILLPDLAMGAALLVFGFAMPSLVLPSNEPSDAITVYSVLLCGMAATAWTSRFQRRWTGLGALLFVLSDTLLVLRMGGLLLNGETIHGLLVWYTYYLGQLCIFVGISMGLTRTPPATA